MTEHLPTRVPCVHRAAGYCSEVARSTFRMEEDFGAARVFQQLGDELDVCSNVANPKSLTARTFTQVVTPITTLALTGSRRGSHRALKASS